MTGGPTTPVDGPIGQNRIGPSWSPDGRRFGYVSTRTGAAGIWISDTNGDHAVAVARDQTTHFPWVEWVSDDQIAWATANGGNYQIRTLSTGRDAMLLEPAPKESWLFQPRFAPDGRSVAFAWNRAGARGLWTLTWPERTARQLLPDLHYPIGWSADRRSLFAYRDGGQEVIQVSLDDGRTVRRLPFPSGRRRGPSCCDIGRDGRAIVCAVDVSTSDAWTVIGFDPQVTTASGER
jgi:Tol biopolymer transport system component